MHITMQSNTLTQITRDVFEDKELMFSSALVSF